MLNIVPQSTGPSSDYSLIPHSVNLWEMHARLAEYNRFRLDPRVPGANWCAELELEHRQRVLENEMMIAERQLIAKQASEAPQDIKGFLGWFEELKVTGPGQNSPLHDWLAEEATYEEMKWFIRQEVAGEAGFEDLTALTQVKIPTVPKLEMARNYWDEMGRGREAGMHGPMLTKVAEEFEIDDAGYNTSVIESHALGNLMIAMAMNRSYAYHSIGALGAIELTAPLRSKKTYAGLKRLGISPEGQRYYLLHASLDVKHSADWNREVLAPLLEMNPGISQALAEGALMRLHAGARCFERYIKHLWAGH